MVRRSWRRSIPYSFNRCSGRDAVCAGGEGTTSVDEYGAVGVDGEKETIGEGVAVAGLEAGDRRRSKA